MTNNEVEEIFLGILESTPGVHAIIRNNDAETKSPADFSVIKNNDDIWNFTATIKILKNTKAKDIIANISSLLKYSLSKKHQKIGKINLFIGGLNND